MKPKISLFIIMVLAIAGVLFSGYLSYGELFKKSCYVGGCSQVGGIPACVYGFVMYLLVLIVSIMGLRSKK